MRTFRFLLTRKNSEASPPVLFSFPPGDPGCLNRCSGSPHPSAGSWKFSCRIIDLFWPEFALFSDKVENSPQPYTRPRIFATGLVEKSPKCSKSAKFRAVEVEKSTNNRPPRGICRDRDGARAAIRKRLCRKSRATAAGWRTCGRPNSACSPYTPANPRGKGRSVADTPGFHTLRSGRCPPDKTR